LPVCLDVLNENEDQQNDDVNKSKFEYIFLSFFFERVWHNIEIDADAVEKHRNAIGPHQLRLFFLSFFLFLSEGNFVLFCAPSLPLSMSVNFSIKLL
jgi:hypothetical protein